MIFLSLQKDYLSEYQNPRPAQVQACFARKTLSTKIGVCPFHAKCVHMFNEEIVLASAFPCASLAISTAFIGMMQNVTQCEVISTEGVGGSASPSVWEHVLSHFLNEKYMHHSNTQQT